MRSTTVTLGLGALLAIACSGGGSTDGSAEPITTLSGSIPIDPNLTASHPSIGTPLPLQGDTRAPDPALIRDGDRGDYFVFSTGDPAIAGGTVQIRRSSDLLNWTYAGNVFDAIPAWVVQAVPGVQNLWAPDIHEHDGVYYLYYAASTFGSNQSVIGLATNTTLDPSDPAYAWVDQGLVTGSSHSDDFNAIDPNLSTDDTDTPWLAFGSFWSGIRMLQLEWPSGKLAPGQGAPLRLADRFVPPNALEASFVQHHDGWYYLYVSFDFCCQGTNSTYKIAVGRSRTLTGPYLDRLGSPLEHGGGTVILSEQGTMFGPGGESIYGDLMAYHFYDGTANGDIRLGIRRIVWQDGWPVVTADALLSCLPFQH
jgi:arabinan endo-1,5-alpha-L-arabinosidase